MDPSAQTVPKRGWPLGLVALAVSALLGAYTLVSARGRLAATLGDTDDALRLVMVRDLLGGRTGWFDTHLDRMQPPLGLDMHWSRLVDGGLAATNRAFGLFLAPDQAEAAMRLVWPIAWTVPAVWAALALSRRLGGAAAVVPAAGLLLFNIMLYSQWWPGRIDHHNLQITMALAAAAGAAAGGARGGLLAGAATGFGLAVGIEALPFLALAGASFALRFLFEPQAQARAARAYGASLLVATSLFYLVQTAPDRLAATACDAIGANLWAGIAVAGAGLFVAVRATAGRGLALRLFALALAGAAAGGAYLGLDPACLQGPAGHVDPRIKPIWMDRVAEMRPLLDDFWGRRSNFIACTLVLLALGTASWLWLGARRAGRTPAWLLAGALLALSAALAFDAQRMAHYVNWFAVPLFAAALGDLTLRYWKGGPIPAMLVAALLSQPLLVIVLEAIPGWARAETKAHDAAERCTGIAALRPLGQLPPGLVLGEIDFGPRILAQTPHSVVAAPYHRMSWGILAANHALSAPPGEDERAVRTLKARYVVTCPVRTGLFDHAELGRDSLQLRLDRGETPPWLEQLSGKAEPLQVYGVRPAVAAR